MDRQHIFEPHFEVFDELGIGEVELLQLVVFRLKGVEYGDIESVSHVGIFNVVVEVGYVVALSVEVSLKLLALVGGVDECDGGHDEQGCQELDDNLGCDFFYHCLFMEYLVSELCDVFVFVDGIEARTHLLPFGLVLAPDVTMAHYLGIRELSLQFVEKQNEGVFLLWCAVVDSLALSIDATDIGDVDGCGVVALHAVAHLFDG